MLTGGGGGIVLEGWGVCIHNDNTYGKSSGALLLAGYAGCRAASSAAGTAAGENHLNGGGLLTPKGPKRIEC